jgi:hypothetical protein
MNKQTFQTGRNSAFQVNRVISELISDELIFFVLIDDLFDEIVAFSIAVKILKGNSS